MSGSRFLNSRVIRVRDLSVSHFLLVANGAYREDDRFSPAIEVAQMRLSQGRWPLYEHTRNRRLIQTGDFVLIYLAGQGKYAQHVLGRAAVQGKMASKRETRWEPGLVNQPAEEILELTNFAEFVPPLPFLEVHPYLSFCPPNISKWGNIVRGGCRRISERDFNLVIERTNSR